MNISLQNVCCTLIKYFYLAVHLHLTISRWERCVYVCVGEGGGVMSEFIFSTDQSAMILLRHLVSKTEYTPRDVVRLDLSKYFITVLHMIGRSKMNETGSH